MPVAPLDSIEEYWWRAHIDVDADDQEDFSIGIVHPKNADQGNFSRDILSNTFHWVLKAGNWISDFDASIEGNTFTFIAAREGDLTEITAESRVRFTSAYVFGTGPVDEVTH